MRGGDAGKTKLITACNNPVEEGMVLYTNSPKVRAVRRTNVELILSQHNSNCATCVRSGNCNLQKLSNDLGIIDIPYKKEIMEMPWNRDFGPEEGYRGILDVSRVWYLDDNRPFVRESG